MANQPSTNLNHSSQRRGGRSSLSSAASAEPVSFPSPRHFPSPQFCWRRGPSMAGAVIENMSTKKLCIVGGTLLISRVIAFLVGGLMAPSATTAVLYMSVKCINVQKPHHQTKWLMPWGPSQCEKIQDLDEEMSRPLDIGDIVFAVHFPLPNREMSSWLQFMIVTMQLDIVFKMDNAINFLLDWETEWGLLTSLSPFEPSSQLVIFALVISMTFINIPVEWFSIGFDWTWMLLFEDIRQGIFYAMLLSFWIIFCGEHVKDQNDQTWLSGYWKWVGPIAVGSFCLFIFDIYERGVQLKNPFYGFWTTDVGMELALMAFITIAGICLCLYFLFLCFLVFKVFQNFHGKPLSLPPIKKTCRIQYQELNIRFKFLMVITLICAAMTIIIFIVWQ
ncbi:hypothetical protein KIL84_016209, partial [Mauremys mutica]